MTKMRFHWRLIHGGDRWDASREGAWDRAATSLPDLDHQTEFCKLAEDCGIEGLLTDIGFAKPDPILLSAALGQRTERIKFIVAIRPGLMSPTLLVQQLNTLSALINGRFSLNVVIGTTPGELRGYGDFKGHDERYARTEEMLAVCRAFWEGRTPVEFDGKYYRIEGGKLSTPFISDDETHPEFYIAGSSEQARSVAISQGSCWMFFAMKPDDIAPRATDVLRSGRTVGIRCSVFAAPTHQEAVDAAYEFISNRENEVRQERDFIARSDSQTMNANYQMAMESDWLTPYLWLGALRSNGPGAMCLVGSADEVADALLEYKRVGVTQFILSGWPKLEQMEFFGREVIPRVREREDSIKLPLTAAVD